jgi:hypothetical protein
MPQFKPNNFSFVVAQRTQTPAGKAPIRRTGEINSKGSK